jgi:hypothetical protein
VPVIAVEGRDRLEAPITGPDIEALVREAEEPLHG